MDKTRIEIILGCMFSGKSTELLRRCNRYSAIGKKVLLINSQNDTRTGNSIKTHQNVRQEAVKVHNLLPDVIDSENFKDSEVIGIDEAQFFEDLYEFVIKAEKYGKTIIIAGLDGDFNRKRFGQILDCIPLCDTVEKLSAMDMVSKDGTPAIFTKRIVNKDSQILVGSDDYYVAVSRKNY